MRRPSNTAIHEAGHAVMAFMLRIHVTEVVKQSEGEGYTEYRFYDKLCPYINAMLSSAGHRAEVLWAGRDIKSLPYEDWRSIIRLGFSMFAANQIGWATERALRGNKDMVMTVARELDAKGRLGAAGFLRLVKPFVKSMGDKSMVVPLKQRRQYKPRGEK